MRVLLRFPTQRRLRVAATLGLLALVAPALSAGPAFDGPIATLTADFDENAGIRPGYKLKLNSYDLGVDIELNDAVNRIRFEHPEVRTVVVTSAKDKVFCSGANIFMLGVSSHAWKVNFCKFTNETRNSMEDASEHSGQKFVTVVNGTAAGGGASGVQMCRSISPASPQATRSVCSVLIDPCCHMVASNRLRSGHAAGAGAATSLEPA